MKAYCSDIGLLYMDVEKQRPHINQTIESAINQLPLSIFVVY